MLLSNYSLVSFSRPVRFAIFTMFFKKELNELVPTKVNHFYHKFYFLYYTQNNIPLLGHH